MRRFVSLAVLAALIALVPASSADAGGNWLGFRREDPSPAGKKLGTWAVLHVGQQVVAYTGIYVMNADRRDMLQDKGPYYAWLSAGDGYLDDANLPPDAIRLAPFEIGWTASNGAPVAAHFTVPSVPSGEYEVLVCNDPCTLSGFGEYVQGWITIVQSPAERRLFERSRERKWEMRELSHEVRRLQGDVVGLEGELEAANAELRARDLRARAAESRAAALESEATSAPAPLVPGWSVALLAAAIVASAIVVRRRREPELVVPDTVPDDLLERDRAGV